MEKYDRNAAVLYAHTWAYSRNPRFYNYDAVGGDCTNFASQCLLAGGGKMDYTPTFGWYYISGNRKAPAWTGVEYLFNFLTRSKETFGPKARECSADELQQGDIVQLSFDGGRFSHTPVVVLAYAPFSMDNILVAAHSNDTDYHPVSAYEYKKIRFLHIEKII